MSAPSRSNGWLGPGDNYPRKGMGVSDCGRWGRTGRATGPAMVVGRFGSRQSTGARHPLRAVPLRALLDHQEAVLWRQKLSGSGGTSKS